MPDTTAPAPGSPEATIAAAHAARDAFLDQASAEFFEPRQKSFTDAVTSAGGPSIQPAARQATPTAAPKPAAARAPQATPAAADPSQSASATPEAAPASQSDQPATATTDWSDIPSADALDQPGTRLRAVNWRKLHAKADSYQAQVGTLTKQIEEMKAASAQPAKPDPATTEQLAALAKERDQLTAQLETVAFQHSPRFKQMFEARETAALSLAKQAVGPEHAKLVESLLKSPESSFRDSQLTALLDDIKDNPIRANKLTSAVTLIDQLAAEKQTVLDNSATYITQLRNEEARQTALANEERNRKVSAVFDAEVASWRKQDAALVDDKAVESARAVFDGASTLESASRAALWGAVGPKVAAQLKAAQAELADVKARLAKLEVAQPGTAPDAGGTIESDSEAPLAPAHMGQYAEGIMAAVLKAGLPLR